MPGSDSMIPPITFPAPCALANWVTAFPTAPPIAGARTVLPGSKPACVRVNLRRQIGHRNTSGGRIIDIVRDQAEVFAAHSDPLAVGSVFKDTVRTGEHDPGAHWKRRVTRIFHNTRSLVTQYQRS